MCVDQPYQSRFLSRYLPFLWQLSWCASPSLHSLWYTQFLPWDIHIHSCGSLLAFWATTRLLHLVPLQTPLALMATFVARKAVRPTLNALLEPTVLLLGVGSVPLLVPLLVKDFVRLRQVPFWLSSARLTCSAGKFIQSLWPRP
jgi:hypothetical protein